MVNLKNVTLHSYGQLICLHDQLIYDKGGRNIQWRKDSLFINWTDTCKTNKQKKAGLLSYIVFKTKLKMN